MLACSYSEPTGLRQRSRVRDNLCVHAQVIITFCKSAGSKSTKAVKLLSGFKDILEVSETSTARHAAELLMLMSCLQLLWNNLTSKHTIVFFSLFDVDVRQTCFMLFMLSPNLLTACVRAGDTRLCQRVHWTQLVCWAAWGGVICGGVLRRLCFGTPRTLCVFSRPTFWLGCLAACSGP